MRVFIEITGFVGDYLESSKLIDELMHRAGSPCTNCSFRRVRVKDGCDYGHSKDIHSSNTSF